MPAEAARTATWRPSPLITASFVLHGAAAVALVFHPPWWPQVLALVLFNHLLLTVCGLLPRSRYLMGYADGGGGKNAFAVQPDGKVLVGGFFTSVNGLARTNLARLNADG